MLPHSTIISSDRGVLVNGGQFTQNNYHGQVSLGNRAPIDILMEVVAPSAFHDSGASFDKPKCHPRTRAKVLEIIMHWILGEDQDAKAGKQFMWLNGTNVQKDILSAIWKDPFIFKKTLQQQFNSLIIQPLKTHFLNQQSTRHRVPFLIVIDGLDECTDHSAQKAILVGMADSLRDSNLCIPIFVASRPEHDIKLSFSSILYLKDMHTALSLDLRDDGYDADSDIRLYLVDRLAKIKDDFENCTMGRKLDQDWPGEEIIEMLVKKSSRQFIYAATVIRYVGSTRHRPDHRLDVVLNFRPDNGDHPFAELDSLYAMILESALDIEKVLHVLSLYLMGVEVCCSVIEKLLSYDEGDVETLFCDLGALVQVYQDMYQPYEPEDRPLYLRFLHTSFREYLLDAARSKQFHIDMDYESIKHLTHALQYLASCCSSSFNPHSAHSTGGIAMYILQDIQRRSGQNRISQITISLQLRQSVLSFPLKEFLEPHSTSPHTYWRLLEDFVTPFMQLLEAMVLNDPTSSYIRNHQLGILRTVIMQQIPKYFNDDKLAVVLVLFYHLGSNRFVPSITGGFYWFSTLHMDGVWDNSQGVDILSLSNLWRGRSTSLGVGNDIYHCFVRQLLHDPDPIAEYARGPAMHERAALACFKKLASNVLPLPSFSGEDFDIAHFTDDADDDTYPALHFHSVIREWHLSFKAEQYHNKRILRVYFLLLGHLIFLLSRCGRSDALVAACEEHGRMPYIYQPDGPFPIRRRLLHKEINDYLARAL
ncbi:hypothetical protein CPC08DRAFT_770818 [Agrocybe pediades]|nr:hypothetical protein CPC08DRAFT_770818 [Agrocybe pediades]